MRERILAIFRRYNIETKENTDFIIDDMVINFEKMTTVIISTIGILITHFGMSLLCSGITIFKYNFKIMPIIVCSLGLMIFAVFIPKFCYGSVSKSSIIERLRENE